MAIYTLEKMFNLTNNQRIQIKKKKMTEFLFSYQVHLKLSGPIRSGTGEDGVRLALHT